MLLEIPAVEHGAEVQFVAVCSHSAPFPRAIPEFFIKAFSDARDVIYDPFLGSGTTLVAAGALNRAGYGVEISPSYCDVILRRAMDAFGVTPTLATTGETFTQVARAREVPADAAADLRAADSKSIRRKPNGMPCYGPQRKAREAVAQTVQ